MTEGLSDDRCRAVEAQPGPTDQRAPTPSGSQARHGLRAKLTGPSRSRTIPGRSRRRRRLAVVGSLVAMALVAAACSSGGPRSAASRSTGGSVRAVVHTPAAIPAIEAGLMPWTLANPLGRASAVQSTPGSLLLIGGLEADGASANGVFTLATGTGKLAFVGTLAAAVHDAAAMVVGGDLVVAGGGAQTVLSDVQSAPVSSLSGAAAGSAGVAIAQTASLPSPRADLSGVTVGSAGYVLGGYNGTTLSATVLKVSVPSAGGAPTLVADGRLAVPVRYAATAVLGTTIYLFGGLNGAAQPVDTIQAFDTATGKGRVIGHLPTPLAGASAGVEGGHLYLAGGATGSVDHRTVYAFDPATNALLKAGLLPVATAYAATASGSERIWLVGGESGGTELSSVEELTPNPKFGTAGAPGAGSPYFGDTLLIADRGNNRLLALNTQNQITWKFPSATRPAPPQGFYFPDDAFFVHHGTAILTNEEEQNTLIEIGYPSGKVLWNYGHPNVAGSAPGYLSQPDDAYLLKNGTITVADAMNCRILFISEATRQPLSQIGTTKVCAHNPPTDVGYPNGDTPMPNGDVLVSEIDGSWVTEYTPTGQLVWTVHLPISYPSDPQRLGPDRYLIADYAQPGAFLEFTKTGKILYRYQVRSGPGMLNHPSLAEMLPSGVVMLNDDYNDRMVAIDPTTGALVWQYGITGKAGTAVGMLSKPDGFDILTPQGTTPTHPTTG